MPKGMKIGPVQLWLLLLLAEKPMYGYEMIRELEKRFSNFWKPQTGTIYPALEKLESKGLVMSRIEFREVGPDRRHYAITEKGERKLKLMMEKWTKMTEMVESYREIHESLFRFKATRSKEEVSKILLNLSQAIRKEKFDMNSILPTSEKTIISVTEPVTFKLVYTKENLKKEFHIEIEWTPSDLDSFNTNTDSSA